MNDASDNMKSRLFSLLGELGKQRPYVSFQTVRTAIKGEELNEKPALLREYLSEAMKKEVIRDAGREWYSSLETPAILDPDGVHSIQLDVITAASPYTATEERVVRAPFFEIEEEVRATVPTAECLLADKLACFAPSTIG